MATIDEHLEQVVLPALREYWSAETMLSHAAQNNSPDVPEARFKAMRRARTAATELHHLADFAFKQGDANLPLLCSLEEVRTAISAQCTHLRTATSSRDVALLRDIADAFKHQKLDRQNARIAGADAVIACQAGYGRLTFGEGKFGGTDQVIITDRQGEQRALTSVLQNVLDAWRRLLNKALPPINDL